MLRQKVKWFISVTLTLLGFGSSIKTATAQTTYEFTANYSTAVEINEFRPDLGIIRATITGESIGAPFGLESFISNTYGQLQPSSNPSILKYNFNSDPGAFGLTNLPVFADRYFGGSNELFGRASDSAEINLAEGTIRGGGNITIFDGTGIFQNATGTITFTQEDRLGPPGTPSQGLATLNFSIRTPRTVPEPTATTTLVAIGLTGASLILSQSRRKGSSN
ncbi:hypothetical protein NUACC21_20380 [Scytonema sp. NUACC21]